MKEELTRFVASHSSSALMHLLHASVRVRHFNASNIMALNESNRRYMLAFWHCHLLLMVFARYDKPITVMISRHRDGEYIASTMRRFGVDAVRGSSSRGGITALKEMVGFSERGWNMAITPDGPRGPARVAQPGVVVAAWLADVPIIPVAVISAKKTQLRSWDRFEIPHPFTRVIYVYGDPITIPPGPDSEDLEPWRARVESALNALCDESESRFDEIWRMADP